MKTSLTENKGNRSGSTILTKFVVIYFAPGDEIKVEIVIGQREIEGQEQRRQESATNASLYFFLDGV